MMRDGEAMRHALVGIFIAMLSACAAADVEPARAPTTARPAKRPKPVVLVERHAKPAKFAVNVEGNAVKIVVAQGYECSKRTRVGDDITTGPTYDCDGDPPSGIEVILTIADESQNQRTDDDGAATFDLGKFTTPAPLTDPNPASATIDVPEIGKKTVSVRLSGTPFYTSWGDNRDRAFVNECISLLSTTMDACEQSKDKSCGWNTVCSQSFRSTFNDKCRLKDRVKTDDRFAPLMKRLAPFDAKTKKCGEEDRAKGQAAQEAYEKKLYPMCVSCCLQSFVNATKDHCEARCKADSYSYLESGTLGNFGKLVCRGTNANF
jgi:hypothetical protein